jgi:hypothetical protein
MSSLPEGLQGILQVLMAKRTMTEEEAATLLARVKDQYHLEVPQDATVTGIFRTINKVSPLSFCCCLQSFMFSLLLTLDHLQELKFMSFEIRSLHMEGQLVHALVNLVSTWYGLLFLKTQVNSHHITLFVSYSRKPTRSQKRKEPLYPLLSWTLSKRWTISYCIHNSLLHLPCYFFNFALLIRLLSRLQKVGMRSAQTTTNSTSKPPIYQNNAFNEETEECVFMS